MKEIIFIIAFTLSFIVLCDIAHTLYMKFELKFDDSKLEANDCYNLISVCFIWIMFYIL